VNLGVRGMASEKSACAVGCSIEVRAARSAWRIAILTEYLGGFSLGCGVRRMRFHGGDTRPRAGTKLARSYVSEQKGVSCQPI